MSAAAHPGVPLAPPAGSRIVIAGGCGGIGRALVAAAVAAELRVFVIDLAASLARHPPPQGVQSWACDASDEDQVGAAFAGIAANCDGLEGFVNLVGFKLARTPIEALPLAAWDEGIAGNLRSAFLLSRAALPLLRHGRDAAIVHVSSGLGSYGGQGYGPYAASKGAIDTLVRILANEAAPGIRANAVAPGLVDTAFVRGGTGRSTEDLPPEVDPAEHARRNPLGRIATPQDLAGPILFLLGPAASFVNGQVLHVNGGAYMP